MEAARATALAELQKLNQLSRQLTPDLVEQVRIPATAPSLLTVTHKPPR